MFHCQPEVKLLFYHLSIYLYVCMSVFHFIYLFIQVYLFKLLFVYLIKGQMQKYVISYLLH